MANENEPAKLLLPYLQRADELQKHEPLVAYYCRLYAMEKGLKIPFSERTKTTSALLVSLMKQLEKDKKSLTLGSEDNLYLEGFAVNVFAKADKQDRAGQADLNTAKTFYAASIFFEIISQFGPLQPDLEQKQKYAAWKAADIRKALKEGRKPTCGPPNGDEDLSVLSSTHSGSYDHGPGELPVTSPRQDSDPSSQFHDEKNNQHHANIPSSTQFHDKIDRQHSFDILPSHPSFSPRSYPSHGQSFPQDPQRRFPSPPPSSNFSESSLPSAPSHYPSYYQGAEISYTPQSAPPTTSYPSTSQYSSTSRNETVSEPAPTMSQEHQYDSNYQPPPEKIAEAYKAARFAVGALAFDDVSVAIDYLKKSLELLTNPSASQ
ncbi:hypothetical protein GOBAR_AA02934 [Gossypium barbadense]|uniref:Vta1/callose synthase N-terminal domain-containing protein n=1 Tax=Gossypium barbadense TaxID=3634 RepID=A0A2P5YPX7_GOSBA|nr:hypothetical protein GOBAR_AA02934 [Gossypium barbadense]